MEEGKGKEQTETGTTTMTTATSTSEETGSSSSGSESENLASSQQRQFQGPNGLQSQSHPPAPVSVPSHLHRGQLQPTGQRFPFLDLDQMDGIDRLIDRNMPNFNFEEELTEDEDDQEQEDEDQDEQLLQFGLNFDDDLALLPVPANFAARVGMNETSLTKAISSGDFEKAEEIINESIDPEYLNDGELTATPLNLALTGRSGYCGQPRHLKLARLLVRRGANVNLRIPNHDLETASESPLEHLVNFYLSLLKTFRGGGRQQQRHAGTSSGIDAYTFLDFLETDLLDTIGLNDEPKMTPETVISQTKELLGFFLEHGADINLQTTDAGRTVFHMVLAAEVTDKQLIEKMVAMGALVNLTDVHGTTPLMDVIRCKEDRGQNTYKALNEMGKRLLLDAQNCCGESALWRSMFHGKMDVSHLLLDEGAASFTMARVQENNPRKCPGRMTSILRRPPTITNLPALLAPLLCDSAFFKWRRAYNRRSNNSSLPIRSKFNVELFNEAIRTKIAPFVDLGWFCTREVEKTILELVKVHTQFKHLTEEKVFQEIAIIPMMFGNLSGGLRQACVRQILNMTLFTPDEKKTKQVLQVLDPKQAKTSEQRKKFKSKPRPSTKEWRDVEPADSACFLPSMLSDSSDPLEISRLTLSEPEMSYSPVTSINTRARHGSAGGGRQMRIGDNWLLQEDPQYQRHHRGSRSLEKGLELEISHNEEIDQMEARFVDHSETEQEGGPCSAAAIRGSLNETKEAVTRVGRMIRDTNEMLAHIQNEVDGLHLSEMEKTVQACSELQDRVERATAIEGQVQLNDVAKENKEIPTTQAFSEPQSDDKKESTVIIELGSSRGATASPRSLVAIEEENEASLDSSCPSLASTSPSFRFTTTDSDQDPSDDTDEGESWGGAFSLSHTLYANHSNSHSQSLSPSKKLSPDSVIKSLSPDRVKELAKAIGLPPGLMPCLELEVARLQLGLAVFRHRSTECDRGCEGEDDSEFSTDDDEDTSWGPDSLSAPSLTLSSSNEEDEVRNGSEDESFRPSSSRASLDFEPSVPSCPRRLTSSSESSDEEEDIQYQASGTSANDFRQRRKRRTDVSSLETFENWFSFEGGEEEHATIRRYVRDTLGAKFEDSTDSDTTDQEEVVQDIPGPEDSRQ